MSEVKVMCGIPGSGKSTWAAKEAKLLEDAGYIVAVISRDAIRFQLLSENEDYFDHEVEVFDRFVNAINDAIANNINIIFADATHISRGSRQKLIEQIVPDLNTTLVFEIFDIPFEVAVERNNKRKGRERVPMAVMRQMQKRFTIPTLKELSGIYKFYDCRFNIHKEEKNDIE